MRRCVGPCLLLPPGGTGDAPGEPGAARPKWAAEDPSPRRGERSPPASCPSVLSLFASSPLLNPGRSRFSYPGCRPFWLPLLRIGLDHMLSPPPMPFQKWSTPEVSPGPGKSSKFKRQLSEDGRQFRRGSLGGALTGKYLLPNGPGQQLWQPAETSNLVRMRYQMLGQSAPSLTAGSKELSLPRRGSL
ncbi:microtubule-associated serine/threonine-protein kinase 4-like [Rhynochetos jubatus]